MHQMSKSLSSHHSFSFSLWFQLGDVVTLRGQVNRAFNSSMEVGVRVEVEDLLANKTTHACSAYFTFVPLLKNSMMF